MAISCPHCNQCPSLSGFGHIVRYGSYYRTTDSRCVVRFMCSRCKKTFSRATLDPCYRQKKRHKNYVIYKHLCSGTSLRQTARVTNTHPITVARKLVFLAQVLKLKFDTLNAQKPPAREVQFDDLETFEHTKCKPVSITLAVEKRSRRILGFQVARMAAKGLLAEKARKKYGRRRDERRVKRRELFKNILPLTTKDVVLESDSNPYYLSDVLEFFPKANYRQHLGARGSIGGQGELKKIKFDPLFSLNHTCAMMRYHVSRLIRKTWNTTKRRDRLEAHLILYSHYHNSRLEQAAP